MQKQILENTVAKWSDDESDLKPQDAGNSKLGRLDSIQFDCDLAWLSLFRLSVRYGVNWTTISFKSYLKVFFHRIYFRALTWLTEIFSTTLI